MIYILQPKFLIAFIGVVGSGKTHIAKILAKKLGAVHIRTDDIRVGLRKRGFSFHKAPALARQKVKKTLSEGKSVISDFDAVRFKRRQELKNLAEKFGTRFILIEIKTPEKLILRRLRKKKYTLKEFFKNFEHARWVYFKRKKFHKNIESRKNFKIRPDFVINNAKSLDRQIMRIAGKLQNWR